MNDSVSVLEEYLHAAKSPYHVVNYVEKTLSEAGFEELQLNKEFSLSKGGKYYLSAFGTSLFAFIIPDVDLKSDEMKSCLSMRIGMAHVDSPTFRLKNKVAIDGRVGNCIRINTEPYGGMLKRTWYDRPLALAGAVFVKGERALKPQKVLFDSKKPWFIIPSLAPHMDHDIEKKEINAQKDIIPLVSLAKENFDLMAEIARKLNIERSDILDFDLELYAAEKPSYVGVNEDFLVSPRIDNISSVAALVEALKACDKAENISLIALFDHEEVGSSSKQGADSELLPWIIEKIFDSSLFSDLDYVSKNVLANSMMVSVDVAHAVHPNYPEKADITTTAELGKGFVIKGSASQRYLTDPYVGAIVTELCNRNGISVQRQANRSDIRGGQTLGPIVASHLPIPGIDIGIPVLGMHSCIETACIEDFNQLLAFIKKWL